MMDWKFKENTKVDPSHQIVRESQLEAFVLLSLCACLDLANLFSICLTG